jgi:hypothetical protein
MSSGGSTRIDPTTLLAAARREIDRALTAHEDENLQSFWRQCRNAQSKLAEAAFLAIDGEEPRKALYDLMDKAIEAIEQSMVVASGLATRPPRALKNRLEALEQGLAQLKDMIGPYKQPGFIFDPAAFDVIAHVVATALLAQRRRSLNRLPTEWGSGIYAIFYDGPLDFYSPIQGTDTPIYVGSASPRAHPAATPEAQGEALLNRVREHQGSIQEVEGHDTGNLRVAEFSYRYLVVKSGWELAAEQYLIRHYKPVWNKETRICTGIGKHGDASSTRANRRSHWDTIHPGRAWALTNETIPNRLSANKIQDLIRAHFRDQPPTELTIARILT